MNDGGKWRWYDWMGNEWRRRRMNVGGDEWMTEEMNNLSMTHPSSEWTYESSGERTFEWSGEWPRRRWISEALMNSHHLDYHCYLSFSCSFSCHYRAHFRAHFHSFLRSFSYRYKVLREYPHFVLLAFFTSLLLNLPLLIKCQIRARIHQNRDCFAAY